MDESMNGKYNGMRPSEYRGKRKGEDGDGP